ncbi:MAG: hypothetical protein II567_14120 [Candidatus Riflebacteria bacterium]|jgi:hypothetical protein|nr:hypothetical protein [Candidatus Riflebacteria bacterium]
MSQNNQKELKLRTNKAEHPKEIVLIQHIDRTFSFPLWLPIAGVIFGLIGEIVFFFRSK